VWCRTVFADISWRGVEGLYASEFMIKVLHAKAKSQRLKPHTWHGFMENLNQQKCYDLIFIPIGSFGRIIGLDTTKTVLKIFYDHLTDDGVLVFEIETFNAILSSSCIWRASLWTREDGKMIMTNLLDLPTRNDINSTISKYELVDGNHIIQTEIEQFNVCLYDPIQMEGMIREAGFRGVRRIRPLISLKFLENVIR